MALREFLIKAFLHVVNTVALANLDTSQKNELALFCHELVETPRVTVDRGVLTFGNALCVLNHLRRALGVDETGFIAVFHKPLRVWNTVQQAVLKGGEEHRGAGVTLTASTTSKLVIQARGRVPSGADHQKPTQVSDFFISQANIGTAPSHLSGHGDSALCASPRNNLGFARIVLRVEDLSVDSARLEPRRQTFGFCNRPGTDQNGATPLVLVQNLVNDRAFLRLLERVKTIRLIFAHRWNVWLNRCDLQVVELAQIIAHSKGRTGHATHSWVPVNHLFNGHLV